MLIYRFKFFLLICVLGLFHSATDAEEKAKGPPGQIAIAPPRIDLQLVDGKASSESITLYNLGQQPIEVAVSVHHWDMDENNEVRIIPPSEQSLDQWMIINPLRFAVDGGYSQTVRFSVRPRVKPEPGEHRAIIYFTQAPPTDQENAKVRVIFKVGVVVYGLNGEITRHGILHSIQTEIQDRTVTARFDLSSEGNANVRMSGRYAVWPKTAFPGEDTALGILGQNDETPIENAALQDKLPNTPVLPGSRRTLTLPLTLPAAGEYVLAIQGKLGDAPFSKILPFKISR